MSKIRFIDLCAGLGGFHHGATLASQVRGNTQFECVLASEADDALREIYADNFREDLEPTYKRLFPVEQCRANPSLTDLYDDDGKLVRIHGRIEGLLGGSEAGDTEASEFLVPEHDLLCAGFPCQPFSKSGAQRGFDDDGRGTVFEMIAEILDQRQPNYVLLENVGNFERHDDGRTWEYVREVLSEHYHVMATQHSVSSGGAGSGLLSPHLFGLPHHRERFFICAQHKRLRGFDQVPPFPLSYHAAPERAARHKLRDTREAEAKAELTRIVAASQTLANEDEIAKAQLTQEQLHCITHWQDLLGRLSPALGKSCMPSFPIWGFELDPWHHYPFESVDQPPFTYGEKAISSYRKRAVAKAKRLGLDPPKTGTNQATFYGRGKGPKTWFREWPAYAADRDKWPAWKVKFLHQNREWAWMVLTAFAENGELSWYRTWLDQLQQLTPSFQKLEWNCRDEELNLWDNILQFRPSGLRVKRFKHVPALVAMTTTQIPVVPHLHDGNLPPDGLGRSRFLLPDEAKQLQGFPRTWKVPEAHTRAFQALGNAVHAEVVSLIIRKWILGDTVDQDVTDVGGGNTQLEMFGDS